MGTRRLFSYTDNGYGARLALIKDSLNRQINIEYDVTEAPYGVSDRLTYKGFGSAPRIVHISHGSLSTVLRSGSTTQTYKQLFPELDGAEDLYDPYVITAVWLPDGDGVTRRYRFLYNSYGELARVELPTGGAIEYDWTSGLANGAADGLIYPVPSAAHPYELDLGLPQIYRRLVTRRSYDAGNVLLGSTTYSRPETQNYDHSVNNLGYVSVSHLNAGSQQLSVENHYFYGSPSTSFFSWEASPLYMPSYSPFPSYKEGREYQTDYLAANGSTLLRRVTQSWDQPWLFWWGGSADTAPPNCPFTKETITTLADSGQVTKTTNVNPQTGQVMIDQFGNPLDVWVYDYGPGQHGGLLRHLHTEFMTVNPVNGVDYTNRTSASAPHRLNLPTRMSVYDDNEVERARTTMEYDNYTADANHTPLVDRPSISGFDSSFSIYYSARGNPTATIRYLLTNGSVTDSVTGYAQYDIAGNTVKAIDARGNVETFDYTDRFGSPDGEALTNTSPTELAAAGQYSYGFATSATNAAGQTTYTQYDYYLAKAVDMQDMNGTTYSGYFNDALDRPTQVISGANRDASLKARAVFSYDDVNRVTTQTSDFNSFAESYPLKTQIVYDGVGRTTESRRYEGGSNYIAIRKRYDALGRVSQESNPFRNGETPVWTTTAYDELSRVISATTPDNSVSTNSYNGSSVTVTDPMGKKQKSISDALGRVTQVYEDPDSVNWLTNYNYDTLDNLIGVSQYDPVSQVTQTRTFVYDSLKRLVSSTNPESGTISYAYDALGNLLVRTDARSVSSHASYDALNRVTRRWYNGSSSPSATVNNSPALPSGVGVTDEVNMFYDSQALPAGSPPGFARGYATGRLVAVTYGGGSAGDYFGFDAMSRVTVKVQQTGGVNYQTTSTYNNGGGRKTLTYPSGHVVNYNYDAAGRLGDKDASNLAMTGNLGDGLSRTYSAGIVYTPFGGMSQEQYGTTTPVYNKSFYNVRGQLTEIRVATTPNDTFWNRGAIINHYSNQNWAGSGSDNNGNLKKQDVYIPSDDAISGYNLTTFFYDYDGLNRVDQTREVRNGANSWVQDYDYDRFGNRKINLTNTWGAGISNTQFSVSTANNRLGVPAGQSATMSYDSAGNLTNDTYTGQGQRTYDAVNRMRQAWANNQWQTYTYDGNGRRVRRNVYGLETWQVYGIGGELLAEYAANASPTQPQREYGYRGGQMLVSAAASSGGTGASYNAVTDFSPTQNPSGAWGYGYRTSGGAYSALTNNNNIYGLQSGMHTWYLPNSGWNLPAIFHNGTGATASYIGTVTQPVNELNLHPGANGERSVVRWTAPSAMTVQVTGSFEGLDNRGASSDASIAHNATQVFSANVVGSGAASRQSFSLTRTVAAGDTLEFSVGYGTGGVVGDSTGLAVTITQQAASQANLQWLIADQLGTPRMIADKTGTLAGVSRHDYLPFGEELYAGYGGRTTTQGYSQSDGLRQHFTGYERDDETGLDYAQARYYASAQGRFTGVDPVSGMVANPQTWNGYTYTLNNPVNLTDPTGMFANAESSGPSWEVDGYGDWWRSRMRWRAEIEMAMVAYDQMVAQGRENLRRRQQKKQQPQPQQQQQQQPQQPQVVDVRKDKKILEQVEQIKKKGKPLQPGQTPTPTSVAVVPGETTNVTNSTYIGPYGESPPGDGYDFVIQPVAYVSLDQGGNIISGGVFMQEEVSVNGGPKELQPPDFSVPPPPGLGGVFIDTQLIARGQPVTTVKQDVYVAQFSTNTKLTVGTNTIVKTPPQGKTPGSFSITIGPTTRGTIR